MPAGNRVRGNNVFGFITDNPLTAGAVTMNSAGLSTLPVVSSAHAIICLDPKRVFGEPEIVVVTSHSASATVATIVRGQYGTTARSHPQNTTWAHVPVTADYIEILTSNPADPYEGQMWARSDMDRYLAYDGANSQRVAWYSAAGRTGCSLRRVAVQSIPDAVSTPIQWDTEDFDSDGFITVTSSTITIPAGLGGLYVITGRGALPAAPTTLLSSFITAAGRTYFVPVPAAQAGDFSVTAIIPLAATNTVTYSVFQDHSGAQNFTGSFEMYRIGP